MSKGRKKKTHYEVLQVDQAASQAVIQGAYRALLKDAGHHPDLGGSEAEAQVINEAFAILNDPEARRTYDRQLENLHPALRVPMPVVRTEYILICPTCRKGNAVEDQQQLHRMKCAACGKPLLPTRNVPRETDHLRAFRVGIYLYDKGMLERSLREFESAVRLEPKNPKYQYWLGRSHYQLRRFKPARKAFSAAAKISPRQFHFQFWLGQVDYTLRNFADAILGFTAAMKARPGHNPTLLRLASCYFHLHEYAKAIKLLEKAIRREPARLQLYTLLGVVYLASKNTGAALKAFRRAERLNPRDNLTKRYISLLGEF